MRTGRLRLWLVWSWRDLRKRWLLVVALGLVIALGTGAYAGLGSTTAWRLESNDASYASLRMHDLRVQLPDGVFVRQGTLQRAAAHIPAASSIGPSIERIVVPAALDASTGDRTLLAPADVVGMPPGSPVDALYVDRGRGLAATDTTRPVGVLEAKFATKHDLAPQGSIQLGTGTQVDYVGTGYTPEYFRVLGRSGQFLGESGFAVLFMTLPQAQAATNHPGQVNDLVLRLRPGAHEQTVRRQLAAAMAPFGATVTSKQDDPVRSGLYSDAHSDATIWNLFASLILLGAAFAAFNLVTRMIDSQRRELGIGMAMGVPLRTLAARPLLAGAQIALLGVLAGTGVGWLMGLAMKQAFASILPLPIWRTPFQTDRYVEAAALGLAIPVLASILPILRLLRLQPIEAIRTSAYGSTRRAGRLLTFSARAHLPGRIIWSMPLRNTVRAPRRTLLTVLGVAAAITSMVATLGLLDTLLTAGSRNATEVEHTNADRLVVSLDTYYPTNSPELDVIKRTPGVGATEEQLLIPGKLRAHGREVETTITVMRFANPIWTPTLMEDRGPDDGLVLSQKAARDLDVAPGDTVTLRHPVRTATGFRLVTTTLGVRAIHPNPLRPISYLDTAAAATFGLAGAVNQLVVVPDGDTATLQRDLFEQPGVTAIEPASSLATILNDSLSQFTGILRIIGVATLMLALLIAFNTASISADERAREHATMFAFGLPHRTVLSMAIIENALLGVAGALLGLGLGYASLSYIVGRWDQVMPDLLVEPSLSATTITATVALGTAVVALAPLLGMRREMRMDVPATLRVVE